MSDPLEEVAENRRKKKRVISAADLNSNKKARLDTANSTQKGNKRLENKEKDKESDAKEEKDSDGKLEPPPYTKIRTSASAILEFNLMPAHPNLRSLSSKTK